MAKSFIHYRNIKGASYASVCMPRKVDGKKDNQEQYLGRVIDKDNGIFQSREHGRFKYDSTATTHAGDTTVVSGRLLPSGRPCMP